MLSPSEKLDAMHVYWLRVEVYAFLPLMPRSSTWLLVNVSIDPMLRCRVNGEEGSKEGRSEAKRRTSEVERVKQGVLLQAGSEVNETRR